MYPTIAPIIKIDHKLCTTPFACKLCLQECPTAVLAVNETKMARMEEPDKYEPGSSRLRVAYRDKCTACNRCMDVCPVDAIVVEMPQAVSA